MVFLDYDIRESINKNIKVIIIPYHKQTSKWDQLINRYKESEQTLRARSRIKIEIMEI